MRIGRMVWRGLIAVTAFGIVPVRGQVAPWDTVLDVDSGSLCDAVNAVTTDIDGVIVRTVLVILSDTGQLVLVDGPDFPLPDTFADTDLNVFHAGLPFGFIHFADDGDGFRTLWWTAGDGTVIHVDPDTGEPSPTDLFPDAFFEVDCDACPFWDDPTICPDLGGGEPPPDGGTDIIVDTPPVTINFCGTHTVMGMALTAVGLGLTGWRRRRLS